MLDDSEVQNELLDNYRYAHDFWSPFTQAARNYTLAASGYTWTNEERQALLKEGREPIELNIMRRPLQFFSGYLRDNIKSIVYEPVEGSDQKTADQFTKLGYYVNDKGNGSNTFLDAADEALKSGMSICGIYKDYSKDVVNGDCGFYMRPYNAFYLDPMVEKLDLSDCSFTIMRDLLSRNVVKGMLPFVDPQIIDEVQYSFRDDKFLSYHPQFTNFSRNRHIIAYDQYYRRTSRERELLVDLDSTFYRDITDATKEEKDQLKRGLYRLKKLRETLEVSGGDTKGIPNVEIRRQERPYIELHILLNGQRVYVGEDKTGITETYPFVPLWCYFEPSIWMPSQRFQGMAAPQYWNQRQFNKRHMKIIDMMDSSISTGFKYLLGSVPNLEDLEQSGQNKRIGVSPDAPQGLDSVQELRGGNTSPSLLQYQEILDKLSLTLANVSETAIGTDEGGNTEVSGKLAEVRLANNLRSNRKVFDQIEQSQQLLGKLTLLYIQKNMPPGKVERILGEPPTDQFDNKEFENYDVIIKEGVRSKSQRDAYYYELCTLKREGLVDVPQTELIRALSMAGKSDLEEAIEAQEKQMQQQQEEMKEKEKVLIDREIASTEEKLALAAERRARVHSDRALGEERISEAAENRAQAALARAKTIQEISSMEEDRVMKVLGFVNNLEAKEILDQENVSAQVGEDASNLIQETDIKGKISPQPEVESAQFTELET